jgi:hypothetical protein
MFIRHRPGLKFIFLMPIPFSWEAKGNRGGKYFNQRLVDPGNYRGNNRFDKNFPAAKAEK